MLERADGGVDKGVKRVEVLDKVWGEIKVHVEIEGYGASVARSGRIDCRSGKPLGPKSMKAMYDASLCLFRPSQLVFISR